MKPILLLVFMFTSRVALADGALTWSQLPALPDAFGFGGPAVGTSGNALIVAGGANFPNGPPWRRGDSPAGTKVWHDRIFAIEPNAMQWVEAGNLPRPLAYTAAVSTPEGIYLLGGETYNGSQQPSADVLRLNWNADTKRVTIVENALPPLPVPSRYHQAAVLGRVIYVTASSARGTDSQQLDVKSFWSLDLDRPPGQRRWQVREAWPGRPREKMSVAVQHAGLGEGGAISPCFYLFSGENWFKDADGELDPTRYELFADAYRYNPARDKWTRIADLPAVPDALEPSNPRPPSNLLHASELVAAPRPAVAATAIGVGRSHVLIFSGANGRSFHLPLEQRPLFPRELLDYHTVTNTWSVAGLMPMGVVTTSAVRWNGQIVIPSGEIRPGIRTNRVHSLSLPATHIFAAE